MHHADCRKQRDNTRPFCVTYETQVSAQPLAPMLEMVAVPVAKPRRLDYLMEPSARLLTECPSGFKFLAPHFSRVLPVLFSVGLLLTGLVASAAPITYKFQALTEIFLGPDQTSIGFQHFTISLSPDNMSGSPLTFGATVDVSGLPGLNPDTSGTILDGLQLQFYSSSVQLVGPGGEGFEIYNGAFEHYSGEGDFFAEATKPTLTPNFFKTSLGDVTFGEFDPSTPTGFSGTFSFSAILDPGSSVPEPKSRPLLAIGLAVLILYKFKKPSHMRHLPS